VIFSRVAAEQEAVVFQQVGQGEGHRRDREHGAGHDPARARARQQRADGQAQLVQQAGSDQPGQQVRPSLGEHAPVAAVGQRAEGRLQVHGLLAGHDDIRLPGQGGAAVRR
jgi:hypothetical protein